MKNNKPSGDPAPSGEVPLKLQAPATVLRVNKQAVSSSNVTVSTKRSFTAAKICTKAYSSSQESLSGTVPNTRRKISTPNIRLTAPYSQKTKTDSNQPLIRTISNIPGSKSGSLCRKPPSKLYNQSNMRRAMSKDRVDLTANKEREKENLNKGKNKGSINCVTIIELEKDKVMLQQQISELVCNAESKKAEIATLKMEINKLKDLQSDDAVQQLHDELESLQTENQLLKERLVQLGAPLEMAALSDTQKEQLLRQTSLRGSLQNLAGSQSNLSDMPKSLENDGGEASGITIPRHLSEWDKASSSSLSEMSVACLQDRIMQMEETHHSTNEELQATLQELTDLQDQITDLQMDNERMSEEKAVLLESLCSQTEKLEECRTQITELNQVLFHKFDGSNPETNATEREKHLVELLKKAQEANDFLLIKQEELSSALEVSEKNSGGQHTDLMLLRDRVKLLDSTIENINTDKRILETHFNDVREQLSTKLVEVSELKCHLELEQQKGVELQKEKEAEEATLLDTLVKETQRDKEKIEEKSLQLQEHLNRTQLEVARYKEKFTKMQEESIVVKNNAHKQVNDLEFRIEQLESEKIQAQQETKSLNDVIRQSETKCQKHMDEKRDLEMSIGKLQNNLNDATTQIKELQQEIAEIKKKHLLEVQEWNKFQEDLLTVVQVASDFRTEAENEAERLQLENKNLLQQTAKLESDVESLKKKQEILSSTPLRSSMAFASSDVPALSNVEKDINAAALRQLGCSKPRDRVANQLSVKSLIESIENATKQAKGQGPISSCSSSTSSLNSVASDSRSANTLLFTTNNDVFIKPAIRSDSTAIRDSKTNGTVSRHTKTAVNDSSVPSPSENDAATVTQANSEVDGVKPLQPRPVSILANKLTSLRRNSYGGDIAEKKDPLASLVTGGGSKRNALLKWCQNKTLGYKGIDITNFSSSWNDGLAFCALMHTYLPNLVPYNDLDCKDKRKNFTIAFNAAESVGITTTLNTNDLITQERPDWQSIMTYVTSVYKHFET